LRQRVKALNAFLNDIYHEQEILAPGRIPAEQVLDNAQFRPEMMGVDVPAGIYAHIAGVDLVRAGAGRVLRPRRQPARAVRRVVHDRRPQDDDAALPRAVLAHMIAPVQHYPDMLLEKPAHRGAQRGDRSRPSCC
jgi:uncharacterized circularly permuted ATP-grasp superfamily protein